MDNVTREQYKQLRKLGYTQENIKDFAQRGRISEKLDTQTFKQRGLLRSTAQFLNMDEFGRGIGQTIYNVTQGEKDRQNLLDSQKSRIDNLVNGFREAKERGDDEATDRFRNLLQQESGNQVDFQTMADGGLNNREVLGSAASTGLNIASLGGAFNLGGKAATGATSVGQAALRGAAQGAVSGGAFGAAEALTEGTGIAPGAVKGAAFGAAVGGVVGGVSKYVDDLTKITPESRLHETKDAFKTLQRKFKDGAVYQGKGAERKLISDPISTITREGVGTKLQVVDGKINTEQARQHIRTVIDQLDDDVSSAITGSAAKTTVTELKEEAIAMIKANESLKASGKVQKTINALDGYFDDFTQSYGDDLTMESASSIRRAMNRSYNPDTVDVERAIGDVMRKVIYRNVPGAQQTLAREGQLIAADKFLDALQGRAVKGGRLGGYFSNLLGAIVGSTTDVPVVGPLAGAAGANKISQFLQSQQLNPIAPQMARGITTLVDQLPTDTAGNISKTAVLNLIAQMSSEGQTQSQSAPQQ